MRKAIELQSDFPEAHSNLGNVLRDLGQFKKAELSLRKAIELNPDFADAYINLGNVLKDLGKLKEAEVSIRKAIELQSDFPEAHYTLGNVLRDLGKLEEFILLSKSTLQLKSINQSYKLQTVLQITIANLLRGAFPETLLNLNQTNTLIKQGSLNFIKSQTNKSQVLIYTLFLTSLYPLLEKEKKNPESEFIPHFGESHCLSFSHQTLSIFSKVKTIQPVLITGGKAWHFANTDNNQWKDSLNQQIKKHNYSDNVFISFGEIDCRKDEGIMTYSIKQNKVISEVCENTINSFVNHMEVTLSPQYSKRYYFGVPAPVMKQVLNDKLDRKRIEIIKLYNSIFKKKVLSKGSYFLDVYSLTTTSEGVNNNIHMCDDTHLSPKCLAILFKNHLCEPKSVTH